MWWHTRRNQISSFHLNRRGRQLSRILAAEVCASAVVMLGTPCSEVAWRVLATRSIHQFPLHFPFRASPCAITFQLDSTVLCLLNCITESIQVAEGRKYFPRQSRLASPGVSYLFFFCFFHECCTPFQPSRSVHMQYLFWSFSFSSCWSFTSCLVNQTLCISFPCHSYLCFLTSYVSSGRAVQDVGLRPLACWDCVFESHRRHGCLLWVLCVVR